MNSERIDRDGREEEKERRERYIYIYICTYMCDRTMNRHGRRKRWR